MSELVTQTARLRLRTWEAEDEASFYTIMNTPAVMRWLGGVQSREQWHGAFERLMSYQRDFGFTFWIVEAKSDGTMLGFAGLKRVNTPGASCPGDMEIGWRFRQEAWGQGYATEAATAVLALAFGRFQAPHVVALTVPGNVASLAVMRRIGMRRREDLDFVDTRFPNPSDYNPIVVYRIDLADRQPA